MCPASRSLPKQEYRPQSIAEEGDFSHQSRKQCRWDKSAEGNVLAEERMESLANLSGYQKPSIPGSSRPLNSIRRQKWQLSNGNQPYTSRQTVMHHNSADLFHLQTHSIQAGGPPRSTWYLVCKPLHSRGSSEGGRAAYWAGERNCRGK